MKEISASALWLATKNGDAQPSSAAIYTTARQAATDVTSGSATVDTNQTVFLVVMKGAFTGYLASVPHGAELPTGNTLTVAYDPSTLEVTDWTINPSPVDTSTLGAAKALPLAP